jgi:hypothetical protein
MTRSMLLSLLCLATMVGVIAQTHRGAVGRVAPIAIARNQNHPSSIAVDDVNVYWVSDSGSTIKRLSKSKDATPATIATGQKKMLKIIIDADRIYFMTPDEIGWINKTGGPPTTLARIAVYSSGYENFLAADESNIYFMTSPGHGGEQIAKVSKGGGEPVILASGVYAPNGLASDGVDVYWASYADGAISKVSVNGGTVATVGHSSLTTAMDIAMDEKSVYCSCDSDILRFSKTGGAPVKLATQYLGFIKLESDEMNLYALSYDRRRLYKISKNGGQPVLLATFERFHLGNFAVDKTNIYWTNNRLGTVMRINK